MFRFSIACLVLCLVGWAGAQTTQPAVTGRIEINGKAYRYTLLAENTAPPAGDKPDPNPPGKVVSPVVMIQPKGSAPAAVHVHALDAKLAAGTPLTARYEWDFGDPAGRYNTLVGWNAAHLFEKPGNYTITLKITDEAGAVQQFTNPVAISDAKRKQVFVSQQDGNDADDGADERHAVQTFDRALKLVGDDCELLFARGGTYEVSHQGNLPFGNLHIGAWGDGDRPKLRWTGTRNGTYFFSFDAKKSHDVVIEELSFDTPFNQDTEQGNIPGAIKPAGTNFTIRNCEFLNLGYAVTGMSKPTGVLVLDNVAPLETGLRAYLVWIESSDFTILGNQVANSTREHVVRSSSDDAQRILIAHNDFTNLDRMKVDAGDQSKTTINFRAGGYVYIADNILKDGVVAFGPTLLMKNESLAQWIVLDGNKLHNAQLKLTPNTQHLMIRNNTMDIEGTEQIGITPTMAAMEGRSIADITIAHNTGLNDTSRGKFLKIYTPAPAGSIRLQNNAFVAPKLKLGKDWACGIQVQAADLSAFTVISGNLWPGGDGSVHYVGVELSARNFLNVGQWKSMTKVKNEQFQTVTLDSGGAVPADIKVAPVPGCGFDAVGKARTNESCVPGAVQP